MAKKIEWRETSFLNYFNDAATKLGYDNIPVAWGIAQVNWKSKEDYLAFVDSLVRSEVGGQ